MYHTIFAERREVEKKYEYHSEEKRESGTIWKGKGVMEKSQKDNCRHESSPQSGNVI